ncbi:23S rRNA (adenine(1618)-N(6))-methyltransferase RlmF [Chromatiaceae bacterium AAb-1]|nr:23S rRNA (adenine(1618)-N(6))-methyltransferase RlmF [Chromatiaceae bacterium AAb-1]
MAKLHPRNPHQGRYDLAALCQSHPPLRAFLTTTPIGETTVNFSTAAAVQALNAALLAHYYQVPFWQLPPGYLCPPIPGRADYLHYAADLLAVNGEVPVGKAIRVLDIGCGANCIYPILATRTFGWQVVGTDIDGTALNVAQTLVNANTSLQGTISLRRQPKPAQIFSGIIQPGEKFALTLCNPPFYRSAQEAADVNQQKWTKLGKTPGGRNFAGSGNELWCDGGELSFIGRMIVESRHFAAQIGWFTTLVSQRASHKPLIAQLKQAGAEYRQVRMQQGQKQSLLLAWRFTV